MNKYKNKINLDPTIRVLSEHDDTALNTHIRQAEARLASAVLAKLAELTQQNVKNDNKKAGE